jgi:cobalt-zinc-cadmium efflux system protein
MKHSHHHPQDYNRAFAVGIGLNLVYVIVEVTYGWLAGSLALIADAWHNLSDVLGLVMAWGASLLAARRPTAQRTYGFRRATILASMFSAILLVSALGAIALEAIGRFRSPAPVNGVTIMVVAGIGVIINTITATMFVSGHRHDLNIKGAFLHMIADAAVSFGVVVSGAAIILIGWMWLDPAISLVIVVIIFAGTWGLLRDSVNLAVDAVPRHIDSRQVRAYLHTLPGVAGIHDLHIWAMSTTQTALTVHLVMPGAEIDDVFLQRVSHELHDRFGIEHPTIQIEQGDASEPCGPACPDHR